MVAPVSFDVKAGGYGRLRVEQIAGVSTVTDSYSSSPLRLLAPRSKAASVWAFASSFGGGLVAGDQTSLDISVGAGARCLLGTQASTKVYRNPTSRPCGHQTVARVADEGLLVYVPDPVQAFAGACYRQVQEFELTGSASLVLLDWFSAGRTARGERWAFTAMASSNRVTIDGVCVLLDSLLLEPAATDFRQPHQMGRFNGLASLVILGPLVRDRARQILDELDRRPVERKGSIVASASPVADGVIVRAAGEGIEQLGSELHRWLRPLASLLGDDPWARKW